MRSLLALAMLWFGLASSTAAELRVVGLALVPSGSGSLRLELAASVPVVAVQLDLLYPELQTALGPAQRGAALGTHALRAADVAPGRRRFLVYSTVNQPLQNGVLAEIPVTHVGAASQGTYTLRLTNAIVSTPNARPDLPLQLVASELVVGTELPPRFSSIVAADSGRVRFTLDGAEGRTYQIQFSTDLRAWTDLVRRVVVGGRIAIEDLPPGDPRHRFYRAVRVD